MPYLIVGTPAAQDLLAVLAVLFGQKIVICWGRALNLHAIRQAIQDIVRQSERQHLTMDDSIARFQKSQEALAAVIARFSDEELTTPGKEGDWSLRDVLAHIAAWDRWGQRAIEIRLTQDDLPAEMKEQAEHPDPFNARAAEAWKGYDAGQARAAFAQAYNDLISFLNAAPPEQLHRQILRPNGKTTSPTASLSALARHKDEHRARLEALLARS